MLITRTKPNFLHLSSLISTFSRSISSSLLPSPSNFDESHVLNQLSDLLPIKSISPDSKNHQQLEIRGLNNNNNNIFSHIPQVERGEDGMYADLTLASRGSREAVSEKDELLSPEEKLRGIFLQKLPGKTAIEGALTSVNVQCDIELVAKVLNKGNLSAASMVTFFNWATKQPKVQPINTHTYCIILKALGRRKYLAQMTEMLQEMRNRGIVPDLDALYIVFDSFIRARQVTKAINLFTSGLGLEEHDTEALNVVLRCLCARSHVGVASSLLVKMKGKVPFDVASYNVVIGGWSRFGRVKEVERLLEEMVEDGFEADSLTYSYVIECLGRAGRIDDAVEIFEGLVEKDRSLDARVYNAMILNFIAEGEIDESLRYYEMMLNTGCEPNSDTYVRLISAFLKARRVADAIEMFDEMLSRGMIVTTGTVTSFLEPLCSYGPPHAALIIYKKARQAGCKISLTAYKLLLMRLSRFGKCGMLLNIWNEMLESGYSSDMQVYEYVINGLCNIGQLESAVQVMEEALQKGFYPSRLICSKLNNKLLTSNKVEIAYKLFLKIKIARGNENARTYWRSKGWHF